MVVHLPWVEIPAVPASAGCGTTQSPSTALAVVELSLMLCHTAVKWLVPCLFMHRHETSFRWALDRIWSAALVKIIRKGCGRSIQVQQRPLWWKIWKPYLGFSQSFQLLLEQGWLDWIVVSMHSPFLFFPFFIKPVYEHLVILYSFSNRFRDERVGHLLSVASWF